MTGESVNLPLGGNDSADPSSALDSPDNLNFWEPSEEDDANPQAEDAGIDPNSEPDATDDGQESDQPDTAGDEEAEIEGDQAEADPSEIKDDAVVTVNGEKIAIGDLKSGYLRERDYRLKTAELGNKRRDVEALSARVMKSVNAVADFLSQQIPGMPDPSMAITEPGRYVREKAMHESAMAQVNTILGAAGDAKDVGERLTAEQHNERVAEESEKLAEAFPFLRKPGASDKFFADAFNAGREFGFTDDEMQGVTDHRQFKVIHYAKLGLEAEKAREKARGKVANAPPVSPTKRPQGANPARARANQEAMKRLNKTGSIHDAMRIDFD